MTHEPQQRAEALAVDARGAAKLLGIGARTVADLAARGELPFVRIGRRVVYPTHLLRKWLDLRAANAAALHDEGAADDPR